MKTLQHLKQNLCLILLTSLLFGCNSWGYRGPLYKWTENDIVFFDVKEKAIRFADTTKKIFFVSVFWNKNQYFEQKDISQNSNSFIIPDTVLKKIANQKIKINVIPQHMTVYSISIKANEWNNKNYVFGHPINDISNYSEMSAEINRLNKQNNVR